MPWGSNQAHQAFRLKVQRSELQPREEIFIKTSTRTMLLRALYCFTLAVWHMGSSEQ